jgi:putative PIN family toxin of toxin-antitoxin system
VPEAILDELLVTVTRKRSLSKTIPLELLDEFLAAIKTLGEEVPRITEPIPAVTRDPKDDFLLAYALFGMADYLLTGDDDLLALNGQISGLSILSPRNFLDTAANTMTGNL